jgi:hypothetical protein
MEDGWGLARGLALAAMAFAAIGTWPVCALLLALYRRAVHRGMQVQLQSWWPGQTMSPLRLASLDLEPDADGRYRINEMMCTDDTWRPTVEGLIGSVDVIMIDLRGFTARTTCRACWPSSACSGVPRQRSTDRASGSLLNDAELSPHPAVVTPDGGRERPGPSSGRCPIRRNAVAAVRPPLIELLGACGLVYRGAGSVSAQKIHPKVIGRRTRAPACRPVGRSPRSWPPDPARPLCLLPR